MAETNEKVVAKKDNFFKKVANSKTVKSVVQIGTTILALADTAFLIWTCIDARSAASASMVLDDGVKMETEVKPVQNGEV